MIVYRTYSVIKPGKMEEAIAARKKMGELAGVPTRIYTASAGGPFRTLCCEMEFESLAKAEEAGKAFDATPEGKEWRQHWGPLTEYGGHAEFWNVQ